MPIKPGSIGKPFPGTEAAILGPQGEELPPMTLGRLALKKGWPAMMRNLEGRKTTPSGIFCLSLLVYLRGHSLHGR
jgi:acyl-coenzyme A synthetase/AMP-(fatty) acid ligase